MFAIPDPNGVMATYPFASADPVGLTATYPFACLDTNGLTDTHPFGSAGGSGEANGSVFVHPDPSGEANGSVGARPDPRLMTTGLGLHHFDPSAAASTYVAAGRKSLAIRLPKSRRAGLTGLFRWHPIHWPVEPVLHDYMTQKIEEPSDWVG